VRQRRRNGRMSRPGMRREPASAERRPPGSSHSCRRRPRSGHRGACNVCYVNRGGKRGKTLRAFAVVQEPSACDGARQRQSAACPRIPARLPRERGPIGAARGCVTVTERPERVTICADISASAHAGGRSRPHRAGPARQRLALDAALERPHPPRAVRAAAHEVHVRAPPAADGVGRGARARGHHVDRVDVVDADDQVRNPREA
jgi:hypothetical protein